MKSKLFLMMCLIGALNFSCSDSDNEDLVIVGELSINKGKVGDELTISGVGFSSVKEENIVTINDLSIPVLEATSTLLKIKIPEQATTGDIKIRVFETSASLGIFKVLQKTLFALKSDYNSGKQLIVIVDPNSGGETIFVELPQTGDDYWYSDLCFLENSNEFIVLQNSDREIKDFKILKINGDTKEFQELAMNKKEGVLFVNIITDGKSAVYLENFHKYDVAYKSSFYKLDINTGGDEFVTEVNNDYVKKSKILNENNLMILMEDRTSMTDSPNRIISFDLSNGTSKEVITGLTYINGFSFGDNNNIYFATKDSYESESTLFELNLTTGEKRSIVNMPKIYGWYANAVYIEASDELVYFLSDHEYSDDYTDYLYKVNVTSKSIKNVDSMNSGEFIYRSTQVIYF